jgi:glycolate oxidase iron-sulfur subunit
VSGDLTRLAGEPAFAAGVARCVRCSICVPACPSYALYRSEADSPRGRVQLMRAAMEGRIPVDARLEEHLDRCLGCRSCEDVCPSAVPFGPLIDRVRAELVGTPHAAARKRRIRHGLDRIVASPRALVWAGRALRLVQALRLDRLARRLVARFSPRTARRLDLLPRAQGRPFDARAARSDPAPTALFHAGCVMAAALGDVQRATVEVLRASGWSVAVPPGQACCGALHHHAGLIDEARNLARRNVAELGRAGPLPVCVNSAGCGLFMKEYGALLAGDPAWAGPAAQLAARVRDLAEMARPPAPGRGPRRAVAVQEACHHWNVQRLRGGARALLEARGDLDVRALPRGVGCCGSAGLWSAVEPDGAWQVLASSLDAIEASGCDLVVTSNPGCLLILRAGLAARGSPVEVRHLAELLLPDRGAW